MLAYVKISEEAEARQEEGLSASYDRIQALVTATYIATHTPGNQKKKKAKRKRKNQDHRPQKQDNFGSRTMEEAVALRLDSARVVRPNLEAEHQDRLQRAHNAEVNIAVQSQTQDRHRGPLECDTAHLDNEVELFFNEQRQRQQNR